MHAMAIWTVGSESIATAEEDIVGDESAAAVPLGVLWEVGLTSVCVRESGCVDRGERLLERGEGIGERE